MVSYIPVISFSFTYIFYFIVENMQKTVDHYLESKHMFYSARYSDHLLTSLGGDFSKVNFLIDLAD